MVISDYVKRRIIHFRHLGESFESIVKHLEDEGHKATKAGVHKFWLHFQETGPIQRKPGTGKKKQIVFEGRRHYRRENDSGRRNNRVRIKTRSSRERNSCLCQNRSRVEEEVRMNNQIYQVRRLNAYVGIIMYCGQFLEKNYTFT